jgi:hypothetical protein
LVIDATRLPKQGRRSVGVARQYSDSFLVRQGWIPANSVAFLPLGSGRPSPRSIARRCRGSFKTSCYGLSRQTRAPIFTPGGSEVCAFLTKLPLIESMSFFLQIRGETAMSSPRGGSPWTTKLSRHSACDDLLKAMSHQEDRQCQMNDAEIMTTALIASLCFRGNHESARAMLKQHDYIPHMLSKSRFSRRLHRMKDIFIVLFDLLAQTWKTLNREAIYVIDSLPIAVCDNIRIRRSKIYSHEAFRGYQASKKRYFYGLKIHLMVTQDGQPVECFLTHGGFSDIDALKYYTYELPDGSIIYADKAYNLPIRHRKIPKA